MCHKSYLELLSTDDGVFRAQFLSMPSATRIYVKPWTGARLTYPRIDCRELLGRSGLHGWVNVDRPEGVRIGDFLDYIRGVVVGDEWYWEDKLAYEGRVTIVGLLLTVMRRSISTCLRL